MTPITTHLDDQQPLSFDLRRSKRFRPLGENEDSLVGQIGWLGDLPAYDPHADLWEIDLGSSTFLWEHRVRCYGAPGGCASLQYDGGPYCLDCTRKYERTVQSEKRQERAGGIVEELIGCGALPGFFRTWTPPALTQEQAVAVMSAQDHAGCVWIHGDRGRGKTVTGYTLLHNALQRCRRVAYADAGVLTEARRDSALRATLGRVDLLMVDDIEKGNLSEWGVEVIHSIFDKRHEPRLRTIVTSEHAAWQVNQLLKTACNGRYGNSTIERLNFPKCKCLAIELTGENLRRTA